MAKKTTTTKNLDSEVAKELEKALDLDLSGGPGDLDIAASMEDLEAQISQAADELARAGRAERATPPAAANPAPRAAATEPKPAELRPIEPRGNGQPAGFSPANDDRQKDYR